MTAAARVAVVVDNTRTEKQRGKRSRVSVESGLQRPPWGSYSLTD
jgi:hypothetical protein